MGFEAFLQITFSASAEINKVIMALQNTKIPEQWIHFTSLRGYEVFTSYLERAQVEEQQHIYIDDIVSSFPEEIPDIFDDDEENNKVFHNEFQKFLTWCVKQEQSSIRFYYTITY